MRGRMSLLRLFSLALGLVLVALLWLNRDLLPLPSGRTPVEMAHHSTH